MIKRTWTYRLALIVPIIAASAGALLATPASANALLATPAATAAMQPSRALACSKQWDITQIDIRQGNGWTMRIQQQQDGSRLWGDAYSWNGGQRIFGLVWSGSVIGNQVNFTIGWRNGAIGDYRGSIRDDGFTSGTATDRNSRATTNWQLTRTADCVQ
jgi:hypothetical protein